MLVKAGGKTRRMRKHYFLRFVALGFKKKKKITVGLRLYIRCA